MHIPDNKLEYTKYKLYTYYIIVTFQIRFYFTSCATVLLPALFNAADNSRECLIFKIG